MSFVFKKLKPGDYRASAFKTHKHWEFTENSVDEDIEVIYGDLDATGSYKKTQTVYNPLNIEEIIKRKNIKIEINKIVSL